MSELSEHIVSAPVVLLTGAGASVYLDKPTTAEFVKRARSEVGGKHGGVWSDLVRSCSDPDGRVDVEVILEHVRRMLEIPEMIRQDRNLAPRLDNAKPIFEAYMDIQDRLCRLVVDAYGDVDPVKAGDLYRWLFDPPPSVPGVETLPFFTLNYDVAVERATRHLHVRLVDGMRRGPPADNRWHADEFHSYVAGQDFTVVLFKLHGSTTWAWCKDDSLVEVPLGAGRDPGQLKHAILYPYLTQKDLDREPFKTGYEYLRVCLARARVLGIVGSSLRDQHLTEIIKAAVVDNPGLEIFVQDPALDEDRVNAILGARQGTTAVFTNEFAPGTSGFLFQYVAARRKARGRRGKASPPRSPTSPASVSP